MTGLTLVVARAPENTPSAADLSPVNALLDHLTQGATFRPRVVGDEARALLCDLAEAVADLATGRRARAVVRLCVVPDPWELGLERAGRDALVSVFQGGAVPEVALHERRLDGDALGARVLSAVIACMRGDRVVGPLARAIGGEPSFGGSPMIGPASMRTPFGGAASANDAAEPFAGGFDEEAYAPSSGELRFAAAADLLTAALPFCAEGPAIETEVVPVDPTGDLPIVIAADVLYRAPAAPPGPAPAVMRADLFSLLFRGRLRITVGDHARELPDVFVFLLAEQLAAIALEALEAWTRGRPYYRRLTAFGAICGVKLSGEGSRAAAASLTLGVPRRAEESRAQTWTFPAVDIGALAQGVVAFGRALTRSLVRRDRAQSSNLRLQAFRARIRELSERLREATRDDSKINDAPEAYRAFAASARPAGPASDAFGRTRLRFSSRWIAQVPSIDLRSTFLCGDRIVVGATREIACLDTRTGSVLWQRPATRAVSVMTPQGLARLEPDGQLGLLDLATGETMWTATLAPRVGSSASGAVVSAPGLPRLLIVSEGTRHLAAVDLHGGEVRWRFAARRGGVFRLRRAGKLVIVASGDPALSAVDVLSGEVVWRFCDRLRFASHVAVDHDALFAMAGAGAFVGRGGTRLHHLDPWSGELRWSVDVPAHVAPVGAPLLGPETVVVATHGNRGMGLVGFDRRTGELRFDQAVCGSAASCLMVDGTVVVNSEGGELVGVSATDGATRYRHVFSGGAEGDRPRRLEPVLRSGALFVPQTEVHVVRPHDGTILGRVPEDIIPDLLRVDERCDVYVAEESGHLAAYSAAPRLALVTPL